MTYTEIKKRSGKMYFYRVLSVRSGSRVNKIRKYLGVNLNKKTLNKKEFSADTELKEFKASGDIAKIKKIIAQVLRKYNVRKASLFGSYARGNQRKNSDIDLLIEPPKNIGFEFVGIAFDLEKALKKKVDLMTYKGISPHLEKYIIKDEVRVI
ncbi:MAG: nucleotidyltransferase family protein [Candidatus Marsarchaeota archaeon]|nr:nucleotidyltransferase family protein [Candidatus Marsarchaeota archaeon]